MRKIILLTLVGLLASSLAFGAGSAKWEADSVDAASSVLYGTADAGDTIVRVKTEADGTLHAAIVGGTVSLGATDQFLIDADTVDQNNGTNPAFLVDIGTNTTVATTDTIGYSVDAKRVAADTGGHTGFKLVTTVGAMANGETSYGMYSQLSTSSADTATSSAYTYYGIVTSPGDNCIEYGLGLAGANFTYAIFAASGGVVFTPDAITATDSGVAASLTTYSTEVTTNGDSDLDDVTLADGVSGQMKNIYCVVEGNAGDTWEITPATMCGGTQISFAGVGEGCTLVYADSEGWVVTANNGGTIS